MSYLNKEINILKVISGHLSIGSHILAEFLNLSCLMASEDAGESGFVITPGFFTV